MRGPGRTESIRFVHRGVESVVELSADELTRLKAGLEKANLSGGTFPWPPASEPHRSPFPGLEPLDFLDAAVFFGRDVEILRGFDRLRDLRKTPQME